MKFVIYSLLYIYLIFSPLTSTSQNPEWINLRAFQGTDITDDGENIWISGKSIIRFNKTTKEATLFDEVTNSMTRKIFADHNKNIWVTSDDALYKYNQENWTTYNKENFSIPLDKITCFVIDSNGNTWYSSENYLVKILDDDFEIINMKDYGVTNRIHCVIFDKNNTPWICCGDGFGKFVNDTVISYRLNWTDDQVTDLAIIDSNNILVATYWGLYRYMDQQYEAIIEYTTCNDIEMDYNGTYWIATNDGLYNYNGQNTMKHSSNDPKLFKKPITKLIIDGSDKWMLINNNLVKYDEKDWNIIEFPEFKLSGNVISDIKKDNDGYYWIATYDGVTVMKDGIWNSDSYFGSSLNYEYVNSIAIDNDNNKWLGCKDKFLMIDSFQVKSYSMPPSGEVSTFYLTFSDENGNIWIEQHIRPGEFEDYIYGIYQYINDELVDSKNFEGITIKGIINDIRGRIWFNTGEEIERYDGENWQSLDIGTTEIKPESVKKIAIVNDSVWVAASCGLYLYDGATWVKFTNEDLGISNPKFPLTASINDMAVNENTIWFTTIEGLVRFRDNRFNFYNDDNSPLMSFYTSKLFIDNYKNLWIGNHGITIYREGGVLLNTKENITKSPAISHCYPNPFSESTTIKYFLEKPAFVKLIIYNTLGQEVAFLKDEYQSEGEHQAQFKANDLPNSMYYYKLVIEDKIESGKMMLIK
ncbi:two-component regulator propeller domain-containing protein [Bacteroidota bacterium]